MTEQQLYRLRTIKQNIDTVTEFQKKLNVPLSDRHPLYNQFMTNWRKLEHTQKLLEGVLEDVS